MANWNRFTRQGNVVDRRGMGAGGLGLVGTILVVGLGLFFGADPLALLTELERQGALTTGAPQNAAEFEGVDDYEKFAGLVLGSLDAYWEGRVEEYAPATLVLFRDRTSSSCGGAYDVAGPHYCPPDQTIYLDERFFEQLKAEYGAEGGDVAEAYVIAHEAGHHIQNLLGMLSGNESAEASVQTELTADCLAGAWLGSIADQGVYEQDEITEALDAASAVGDDNIQARTQGTVQPETWTHGSSEARQRAVLLGYQNSADPSSCLE